jgi:GNAT superfamily N-acetyltransferase
MRESPRWRRRLRFDGKGREFFLYETISLVNECPVEVVEIRTGQGMRMGWAQIHHLQGECTSILKEFFIWPTYRRRGCGGVLHEVVERRARTWHSATLEMWMHEADSVPTPAHRGAARGFATAMGYELRWRRSTRPNLAARATKAI